MEQIKRAFDATASRYDGQRKWIIPEMDDYYSAAVWAAECQNPAPAILDIGSGTGLLTALMIQKFPGAQLTLVDLSESMLSVAKERFADRKEVRCRNLEKHLKRGDAVAVVNGNTEYGEACARGCTGT